jgi:hypothetical protein
MDRSGRAVEVVQDKLRTYVSYAAGDRWQPTGQGLLWHIVLCAQTCASDKRTGDALSALCANLPEHGVEYENAAWMRLQTDS